MEACRAQANRAEAESRGRADAEVARERASLREATSALEVERGELLQRAAKAEATGQAKAIEVKKRFVSLFLFPSLPFPSFFYFSVPFACTPAVVCLFYHVRTQSYRPLRCAGRESRPPGVRKHYRGAHLRHAMSPLVFGSRDKRNNSTRF